MAAQKTGGIKQGDVPGGGTDGHALAEPFKSQAVALQQTLTAAMDGAPASLTRQQRAYVVTAFLKSQMQKLGYDNAMAGNNKLGELLACELLGMTLNEKPTGSDATTSGGAPVELKTTTAAGGKKANAKVTVPLRKEGESAAAYKERIAGDIRAKGTLTIVHHNPDTDVDRTYAFAPEFITGFLLHRTAEDIKPDHGDAAPLNLGSTVCRKCGDVHRLRRLLELNSVYMKEPNTFDFTQLDSKVPSQCQ